MNVHRVFGFGSIVVILVGIVAVLSARPLRYGPDLTLYDLRGQPLALQALRGKVVLVNFWATTCAVCVAEMPEVVETYRQFERQGLELIAVSMPYDPPNRVAHFAQTRQLPFHVVMDVEGKIGGGFGSVEVTPTMFLIGKSGEIVLRIVGRPDFDQLKASIARQIAQPVGSTS